MSVDMEPRDVRQPCGPDKPYSGQMWKLDSYDYQIPLRQDAKEKCIKLLSDSGITDKDPHVCRRKVFRNKTGDPDTNSATQSSQVWTQTVIRADKDDWNKDLVFNIPATTGWSWEHNVSHFASENIGVHIHAAGGA